ncbi:MAG: toll/interleukin-1 receptor domain-containing protein [Fibromonadales bacterium]|nr:toll/interleukin-1 receptor domain-containing protein [Fibromonadales bacterium]
MSVKYDIFISYRRKGGYDTAKLLYDRLRMEGYSVSFDIDTLEKGDFDKELESRVRDCKDFLAVLNPGIFDRFFEPGHDPKDDWVRREIACALTEHKNVVPIILDGFNWPKETLPDDVIGLTKKNGIDLNPKHFEAAYANLKRKFLDSQPFWAIKHKKKIIASLFFVLAAIAAFSFFMITELTKASSETKLEFQLEKQKADSLARVTDSIIKRQDSLRSAREERQRQNALRQDSLVQAAKLQPELAKAVKMEQAQKTSDGKILFWNGPNDPIGRAILEKLQPAGVQRTRCPDDSGIDGINISVTSPNCTISRGNIECNYSPKFTITDCKGKLLSVLEVNAKFRTDPHTEESAAREELANELRSTNFDGVIAEIKKIP